MDPRDDWDSWVALVWLGFWGALLLVHLVTKVVR